MKVEQKSSLLDIPPQNSTNQLLYLAVTITAVALVTIGILGCYPIGAFAAIPVAVSYALMGIGTLTLLFIETVVLRIKDQLSVHQPPQSPLSTDTLEATTILPSAPASPKQTIPSLSPPESPSKTQHSQITQEEHSQCILFYKDCDGIEDKGWENLRAIQTFLSAFGKVPRFTDLRQELSTYNPNPSKASELLKQYLDARKMSSTLLLYNPKNASPQSSALNHEEINEFSKLRSKILSHFRDVKKPIMITNIYYSYVITDATSPNNDQTLLCIRDPNVNERKQGVYKVTLNADGWKIPTTAQSNGNQSKYIDFGLAWTMIFPI